MLSVKDVTKSYDGQTVLNKINLGFKNNEVVGLVGLNGTGKSTLLKIIAGELKPDSGVIEQGGEVISYLPQYITFKSQTVLEFLSTCLLNSSEEYKIEMVLAQVGLESLDKQTLCLNLSGGQQTKLYLASILLQDPLPTVLLLDEPTNNLDLEGLTWLETFIHDFRGTIVLTSHDRFFLDRTVHRIIELDQGDLKNYGGNYSFYKQQKQTELEAQQRAYVTQQKKIKKVEEDILEYKNKALAGELMFTSRNPYQKKKAGKAARTAIVRQKKLEKFLESEQHIERPQVRKKYGVDLKGEVASGKMILEVTGVSKSFEKNVVLSNVTFDIHGNERVWLLGSNGSGKTTLLKIIQGELQQDRGLVRLGENIKVGYISQETKLDLEKTSIDLLKESGAPLTLCFTTASYMHLFEDDLRKKASQLSRGQVAKIEFIRMLLSENDLIILDEPTNHLEIETREEIETALEEYKGAILVVSHDRYFVEKLNIDRIIEL